MQGTWRGIYVASATPFDDDGQVNGEEFARLVRFHLDQGVNGCFVAGTTGEGVHLTDSEVLQLCRIAVAESQERGRVIAHIGGRSTGHQIRTVGGGVHSAQSGNVLGYVGGGV